jgi:hypothetical protein
LGETTLEANPPQELNHQLLLAHDGLLAILYKARQPTQPLPDVRSHLLLAHSPLECSSLVQNVERAARRDLSPPPLQLIVPEFQARRVQIHMTKHPCTLISERTDLDTPSNLPTTGSNRRDIARRHHQTRLAIAFHEIQRTRLIPHAS